VTWALFFLHALSPFVLALSLFNKLDREKRTVASPNDIAMTLWMSIGQYAILWFLPHWGIVALFGHGFEPAAFLGHGEPMTYWFPYAVGGYYLLNRTCLQPRLKSERLVTANTSVNTVLFIGSAYVLFVFYVKWLCQ